MNHRFLCSVTATGGSEHMNLFASVLKAAFSERCGFKPSRITPIQKDMTEVACGVWCGPEEVETTIARLKAGIKNTGKHFVADEVPFRECWTLSRYLPTGEFVIEYRRCEGHEGESGEPQVGKALFKGGELKSHDTEVPEISRYEQYGPFDRGFIQDIAEEVLNNVYRPLLSEIEGGCDLLWKEKMTVDCDFAAFEHLKSLLDPIDQEALAAVEASFRIRLELARRRNEAANLAQAIGEFVQPRSDTAGLCNGLDGDAVRHLVGAEQLLRKVAGGVPATCERY